MLSSICQLVNSEEVKQGIGRGINHGYIGSSCLEPRLSEYCRAV